MLFGHWLSFTVLAIPKHVLSQRTFTWIFTQILFQKVAKAPLQAALTQFGLYANLGAHV
jgi:hypothetical protein